MSLPIFHLFRGLSIILCLYFLIFSPQISTAAFILILFLISSNRITGLNAIIANLSQPLTTLIDKAEVFVSSPLPLPLFCQTNFFLWFRKNNTNSTSSNDYAHQPANSPHPTDRLPKTGKHALQACDFLNWKPRPKKANW